MAITDVAKHDATQRARDKADGKAGKCAHRSDDRIRTGWKEQRAEDQSSCGTVEKKVIPLQGIADHRSEDNSTQRG